MRRRVAQPALADIGGLDHQMGGHREISEQSFAGVYPRMARRDHLAKTPYRNDAETRRRRE
jgi:hypothetical protein